MYTFIYTPFQCILIALVYHGNFSTTQCAYTGVQLDTSLLSDIDAQHGLNDAICAIIIHVSHKFSLHCNHIRH